jgi:hypothetical protein
MHYVDWHSPDQFGLRFPKRLPIFGVNINVVLQEKTAAKCLPPVHQTWLVLLY